jgi:TonB family protein
MKIDKDKRRGIIGSAIVHIILFISLFLIALRTPLPLPGEEGVEVNLGYTETGIGNVQSDNPPPQSKVVQPKKVQPQPQSEPEPVQKKEEIIKQDIEEAPSIEEKTEKEPVKKEPEKPIVKTERKKPEPVKEPEEKVEEKTVDSTFAEETKEVTDPEPQPVVNKRALFTGTVNNNTQGTNQGIAGGIGDQGKPKGFKDSDKYDGRGGKGNGPSFDLGGRGSLYLDEPNTDFKEQGDVVVDIWVNRNGKVVKAQVKSKGTNILDPKLRQKAVDAAKNSKFESDSKAEELQRGTITYKFVLLK